jgi:short-subunit dehydrogenase
MARPCALVSGASSGIGESFVRALGARDHDIVAVARRRDRLESIARQVRQRYRVNVHVIALDLSTSAGIEDLTGALDSMGLVPDVLVNNAGFGSYGPFAQLSLERELRMIDVNVRALVALTGHFLPRMIDRGSGAILQIASTTAFQPVPYMAVYGATKAFVLSFSEAVARECDGSNVRVLAVCPGHTPTEFQAISGVDQRPTRTSAQSADDVVREALAALDRGRSHVVVTGAPNRLTTQIPRVLPRRVMSWIVERAFRPRAP